MLASGEGGAAQADQGPGGDPGWGQQGLQPGRLHTS